MVTILSTFGLLWMCSFNFDSFHISKSPLHFKAGIVLLIYLITPRLADLEIEGIHIILCSS